MKDLMKDITVKVIPQAKRINFKQENGFLKIYLTAPAVDGKANKQLIELLAKHFAVKKNQVKILKGERTRVKEIRILPS